MRLRRLKVKLLVCGLGFFVMLGSVWWIGSDRPSGVLLFQGWTNSTAGRQVAVFTMCNQGRRPLQRDVGFIVEERDRPDGGFASDWEEIPHVLLKGQSETLRVPTAGFVQGAWRVRIPVYRPGVFRQWYDTLDESGWTWARPITAALGRAVPTGEAVSDWIPAGDAPNQPR